MKNPLAVLEHPGGVSTYRSEHMTTNNIAQPQQNSATAQKNIESNLLARQISEACEAQRSKEQFEAEIQMYVQVVGQYLGSIELNREFPLATEILVMAIRELRWKGRLSALNVPGMTETHKLRLELLLYHHEADLLEKTQLRAEIEKAYQIFGKGFDRAYDAFLCSEGKTNSESQKWTASVIREELEKIAHQNFSESDRKLTISQLAQESRWPVSQLNSIYADIVAELDERDSQQTTKAKIEQILQANQSSINLSEVLPENLARPLTQLAKWMNLQPEVCLVSLLGTVSSLHRTDTELLAATATDYRLSPNLFIGLVAESSQKKSPILKAIATKPLGLLHRDECDRYEQEMATWKEACKRIQSEDKYAEMPPEPQKRVHWLQRTTGEALLRQAGRQQHGMLYLSDELKALFGSLNSYRGGRGSDEEDLLELYDGSGAKTLRAEGLRDDTDKTCLGILGAIQPEILEKLIGGKDDGNGKWARFFFVHQPNTASTLPISGGLNLTEMLAGLYRSISALPAIEYQFDSAAQLRFKQAYDRVEQLRVKEPNQSLRAVYGKTAGRIGKIALNLHVIRWAMGDRTQPISHEIGMDSLLPAIKLANFAIQQIKSLYGQFDDDSLAPHLMKILNLAESKGEWIKARDVQPTFTKKQRPSADQVRQHFVTLADMGLGEIQGEGRNLQFCFCQHFRQR